MYERINNKHYWPTASAQQDQKHLKSGRNWFDQPLLLLTSWVLKFDHQKEAPNGVYNELVAMRLGVCVGAPIAMGTMVAAERYEGFVSRMIVATNFTMQNLDELLWAKTF